MLDPMFAEFVAEQEALQAQARYGSDDWSESMDPEFSDALDAWSDAESDPFNSWFSEWSDPDFVPIVPVDVPNDNDNDSVVPVPNGTERNDNGTDNGTERNDNDSVVPIGQRNDNGTRVPVPNDSVVPVAGSCSDADAESFGAWVSPGRKLSGVTRSALDDFGDRVDDDGLQARGLRRVPSGDGRGYWWSGAVWLSSLGVEDWVESFRNSGSLEGFAVVHDRDEVDDHLHFLVRRRGGRRKASERQIQKLVDEVFGTRVPVVSSVDDMRSAAAYLVHLNASGKFHYDVRSVVSSGSVSFSDWVSECQADWLEELWLMQSVIEEQLARGRKVTLQGFLSWVHAERRDWWSLLVQRSSARAYLKDFING